MGIWEGWTYEQQDEVLIGGFDPFKAVFPIRVRVEYTSDDAKQETSLVDLEGEYDLVLERNAEGFYRPIHLHISAWTFEAVLERDLNHPDRGIIHTPGGNIGLNSGTGISPAEKRNSWIVDATPLPTEEDTIKLLGLVIGGTLDHQIRSDSWEAYLHVLFVRPLFHGCYERVVASKIAIERELGFVQLDDGFTVMRVGRLDMFATTIRLG
jgi:hypothetical protein